MTTKKQYRKRAMKAWRTKRRKAITADYQRRARKAWKTKGERYSIGPWA